MFPQLGLSAARMQRRTADPTSHLSGSNSYNISTSHPSSELDVGFAMSIGAMTEQDRQISEIVTKERSRLRNFIRRRVPDPADAEDIVQEVFYELVEANRLLMPIEHVTSWLFTVARNRITDLFRKKKPENFSDAAIEDEAGELLRIEDLLPSPDAGPDAIYLRNVLLDELELALEELPDEQRDVFVAHEVEGRSFKEIAAATGVGLNTLLSRKRYAVLHLRERLQDIYDELMKG
jgi:RNA polymerase sigma factor (sigma-70 family)